MIAVKYIVRTNFAAFVDFAFRVLHPGKAYLRNWHIQIVAGYLQLMHRHEGHVPNRVIINLPPGYLKTHICAISYPCWLIGRDPQKSILLISSTPDQAKELLEQCRELMNSQRYRAMFSKVRLTSAQKHIQTHSGGSIHASAIGYSSQHKKSDLVILDSPENLHNQKRMKPEILAEIIRLQKDRQKGGIILVTRKLSTNDLSCKFRKDPHRWGQLSIPAVALEDEKYVLPHTIYHRKKGELLQSELQDWDAIDQALSEMGGDDFCHQYLQSKYAPSSEGNHEFEFNGRKKIIVGQLDSTSQVRAVLQELKGQRRRNRSV